MLEYLPRTENMLESPRTEKRTVFRGRSSRKTVSYEEQMMSKDKHPSIYLLQMEAFVFTILQIFFAAWLAQLVERRTAVLEVEGSSPRPDQHSRS